MTSPLWVLASQFEEIGSITDSFHICIICPFKTDPLPTLNLYSLDFVLRNGLVSPVVDSRGFRVGVCRHLLRFFELGVRVIQVRRDPGPPKRVIADGRIQAGGFSSPTNHVPRFRAIEASSAQIAGSAPNRLKQRSVRVLFEARCLDIIEQVGLQRMMAGHLVLLASFFAKSNA